MASAYQILATKRAGRSLSEDEIRRVVAGAVDGSWTEGQLAAFLMASVIQGLDETETRALTMAMVDSGDRWHLEREVAGLCDKHSTGGVGDKVSLILAPLLAAAGAPVAMLTGRGLGHTGGTADKLETIPGLDLEIDRRSCLALLEEVGMAIGIATESVAPADQRLYGLRDATATVDSLPLITASILSKKLATGAAGLVLDVKVGNGAVFEELEGARELARSMVETASGLGFPTSALLTDMSQPLGSWVGNAVEIRETLACLEGAGPPRLMELVFALCQEAASLAGSAITRERLEAVIASGAARERLEHWVAAQGGDVGRLVEASRALAPCESVITASGAGWLGRVDCRRLGFLLVDAGAGRAQPSDVIDPGVGLHYMARLGQRLEVGDEIARVYLRQKDDSLVARASECFEVTGEVSAPPLIAERVTAGGAG